MFACVVVVGLLGGVDVDLDLDSVFVIMLSLSLLLTSLLLDSNAHVGVAVVGGDDGA